MNSQRRQHREWVRQELLEAIHGAGAFRMFRSTIRRLGIEKSWYLFREEALASWSAYQETGRHLTADEVRAWLDTWGTDAEAEPPACHT